MFFKQRNYIHLTALSALFSALLIACDETPQAHSIENPQSSAQHKVETTQKLPQNSAISIEEKSAQTNSNSPTQEDIANLTRAMSGGAIGIMPDDVPRDKNNRPYIIGDLGGVPVNLPRTVVRFVEYSDSPGFNREALKNFKPSVRSYESMIISFGFEYRLRDGALLDRSDSEIMRAHKRDLQENNDWVKVSIRSGYLYGPLDFLENFYHRATNPDELLETPLMSYWVATGEQPFGLALYVHPGNDPQTGKPWREHKDSEDLFVFRDANHRVQTMIRCGNRKVINSCNHYFNFPETMGIWIQVWYRRELLADWKKIEQLAIKSVLSFRKTTIGE